MYRIVTGVTSDVGMSSTYLLSIGLGIALSYFRHKAITWTNVDRMHYCDVIMGLMASQITSLTIVYTTVYSGGDQRKHQSSASLAFVRGIHRWPVNSPHKGPVTRKMFPFDDVIMCCHGLVKIPVYFFFHFKQYHGENVSTPTLDNFIMGRLFISWIQDPVSICC